MSKYDGGGFFTLCLVSSFVMTLLCIFYLNSIHKENLQKIEKPKTEYKKPISYVSSQVTGNVQSIHIWGRTEIVPINTVQLTRYFYQDNLWVLEEPQTGGIIQPTGRKGYFMPVMSGILNTEYGSTQLIDVSNLENGENDEEKWSEFRIANLIFKNDEPVAVHYRHYNYDYTTGSWKEIAGYEATFNN